MPDLKVSHRSQEAAQGVVAGEGGQQRGQRCQEQRREGAKRGRQAAGRPGRALRQSHAGLSHAAHQAAQPLHR